MPRHNEMTTVEVNTSGFIGKPQTTEEIITQVNTGQISAKESENDAPLPVMNMRKQWPQVMSCCIWALVAGVSDAAAGALLPDIEKYYKISYAVVSLIWLSTAIGFVIIAMLSHFVLTKIPFRIALMAGILCQILSYSITASGVHHFVVVVVGFGFLGMGCAMGLAQYNVFLTCFGEQSSVCLSLFHGFYGFGGFISPLIAQQFLNAGIKWHYYYIVLVGITLVSFVCVSVSFRKKVPAIEAHASAARQKPEEKGHGDSAFVATLKDYRTWLLSVFVFLYQGSEVAMAGWIVSFMQTERHGNPRTMGYVSSGYWAGLTVGRFFLTTILHNKIGVRRSNIILIQVVTVLLLIVWLAPVIPLDAVCMAFVGMAIGPIYPLMVTLCSRLLPRKTFSTTMLILTSLGSSGGAVVPLVVGVVSEFTGTWVLFPIVIGFVQLMMISWIPLPNIERKGPVLTLWQKFW